jgi:superfamily I DNA/RNA helicase
LCTTVKTEDEDKFEGLWLDYKALTTGEKALSNKQEYQMNKYKSCPDAPYEFVYGYAITCHKAQGSEWSKVLVFEERFPFSVEDHKRWLYTACTRASEKLVIVKK